MLGVGITAVIILAGGLVLGWQSAIRWTLLVLGLAYVVTLVAGQAALDARSPMYAGGLLLLAELGYWSVGASLPAQADSGVSAQRVIAIVITVLTAIGVGALLFLVAGLPIAAGATLTAVGIGAAIAAMGIIGALVWRRR